MKSEFNATIAYTDVLSKYNQLFGEKSGVSKGNYIWIEFDDPLKFYAIIQKVAEYLRNLRTLYRSLDQNSLLIEINGYIYNLTNYYVYRKFLCEFERIY